MDMINFILSFFLSKNLSLLTAFLCWDSGQVLNLQRIGALRGVRIKFAFVEVEVLPVDGMHREGVVLDVGCPKAAALLQQATSTRAFNYRYSWLLLHNASFDQSVAEELLAAAEVLPDADVILATADLLVDVYRVKTREPLLFTPLPLCVNSTQWELTVVWNALPSVPSRRKNLNNVYLKAVATVC
ncbi:hypothetical protein ACJJTC_015106 [Scirpophaga incertulas]